MGIHIDHLSLFVVGGGHIFVGDIAVLGEGIESRIEVLCCRKKIATAGMIQLRFQALLYILCLEHLNDLFSLDNVPVGSIHAETIKCKGFKISDVQARCGFNTPQAIFKWMRGDAVPTIDNLIILADMFDVPIDKIIIVTRI